MKFQNIIIECYRELQENLIRSHAAGVGPALSPDNTRMLLALRINVLSKGHSGISLKTLRQLIDAFNGAYCYCIITIKDFQVFILCISLSNISIFNIEFSSKLLAMGT